MQPDLLAAIKAVGTHRAQVAAARAAAFAGGQKALVAGGPVIRRGVAGRPLQSRDFPVETAIDRFHKASGLVYRGAMAHATAVGSVRWQTEVLEGDAWVRAEQHDLQGFLDQPHSFFTRQAWNELLVIHLILCGNSLHQKTAASGRLLAGATKPRLLEMVPLLPLGINPVPHETDWIARYEFAGPPKKVWAPDEILHLMLPDPGNLFWGLSPLQPIAAVLRMDLEAIRWNLLSMAKRTVIDGVYTTKAPMTPLQFEETSDQLWEQHQGPEGAHGPLIIGGDATWSDNTRSPVEMDFIAARKSSREEVLSTLSVPPVMAGFFENATLANAEVSRRLFWEDATIPLYVERIAGALNRSIVPHFGKPGALRVTYDISGIPALRDDVMKKLQGLAVGVRSGVPYNQLVDELELDLDPIPGAGDLPYGLEEFKPKVTVPAMPPPNGNPTGQGDGGAPLASGDGAADLAEERDRGKAVRARLGARGRKLDVRVTSGTSPVDIADSEAPGLREAFLDIIRQLRGDADAEALLAAVRAGDAAAAMARLGSVRLASELSAQLNAGLGRTVRRGAQVAAEDLAAQIGRAVAGDASRLQSWLKPYLQGRVSQLVETTESAARELFADLASGRLGDDLPAVARLARETWGLHRGQAAGVRNLFAGLLERGKAPGAAADAAAKVARARLLERAAMIAEHEALTAANRGAGLLHEQAVADGLVSSLHVTWFTADDGDVDPICLSLEGQEINVGAGDRFTDFEGATYREPPCHPGCRCGLLAAAVV